MEDICLILVASYISNQLPNPPKKSTLSTAWDTLIAVKVEAWNSISLCPNLELSIVWNWFIVLALFGSLVPGGSVYLLKTAKVNGKALLEVESGTMI